MSRVVIPAGQLGGATSTSAARSRSHSVEWNANPVASTNPWPPGSSGQEAEQEVRSLPAALHPQPLVDQRPPDPLAPECRLHHERLGLRVHPADQPAVGLGDRDKVGLAQRHRHQPVAVRRRRAEQLARVPGAFDERGEGGSVIGGQPPDRGRGHGC